MIVFEVDRRRGLAVARRLLELQFDMPEYVLPRNAVEGSQELALYYTFVTALDYMVDSAKLWSRARELFEEKPEVFEPDRIMRMSDEELEAMLRRLGARRFRKSAEAWRQIAGILLEKYAGDPRNLTPEPLPVAELTKRLREFPLIRGCKLMPLYLRIMHEKKLLKLADPVNIEIPVDIQILRLSFYTGFLKTRAVEVVVSEELRRLVRSAWRDVASELGVSPWRLDKPAWSIARAYCSKLRHSTCPLESVCEKEILRVVYRVSRKSSSPPRE